MCGIYPVLQPLYAQDKNEIIQQRIEFIAEQLDTEQPDLTNIIDQLNYYFENPLNLNLATSEELEELNLLSPSQISELILHRSLFGKLISIYELQSLQYWDMKTIQQVLPFVRVDDRLDKLQVSIGDAFRNGSYELYLRYQSILEHKNGYAGTDKQLDSADNNYYLGNKDEYYTRFRFHYRTNLSIGITGEKDAGEEFFRGSQKNGFDFYSAHIFYKGGKYIRTVALGDYQLQIGQGLNLWSGYAFAKTADVINVKKTANTIRPYTSIDETRFMRGTAVEFGLGKLSLCTFVSKKNIDASVLSDSTINPNDFSSGISLGGLHRTHAEMNKKHTITEQIIGSYLQWRNRNFRCGLAGIYQQYNKSIITGNQVYNQFNFSGQALNSISSDYSWVFRNVHFFGEISRSSFSNALANLHGLLISLDQRLSLSILYRSYQRAYYTFYNRGFSDAGKTQNENGIYSGIKLKMSNAWTINAYFDLFRFPWLKYQVNAPSHGQEMLFQVSYKPSKQLEMYGRVRIQLHEKNNALNYEYITDLVEVKQQNLRFNITYLVSEAISIRSRIEHVSISQPGNKKQEGLIFTQDLYYKPKNLPFDLAFRYSLFDTDNYNTRIYTYETNAQYLFSIPSYYYQGNRAYAMIHGTLFNHLDYWIRYGTFIYNNRTSIGSGPELIKGSTKSDLTIQMRYTF